MKSEGRMRASLFTLIGMLLYIGTQNVTAQETPVVIENADLRGHYVRPVKIIHSGDGEARRFGAAVVLEVIVSAGGNVESVHAVDGPRKFFSEAESIERERQFKPFEQDGGPVRARIRYWVQIVPPEQLALT